MGLTVHYQLNCVNENPDDVKALVTKMRQLATDLPFGAVGDIVDIQEKDCEHYAENYKENDYISCFVNDAIKMVVCPWNKTFYKDVLPSRAIGFNTLPGFGCESAAIGLCLYPQEIQWEYNPIQDEQFFKKIHDQHAFSPHKWHQYCKKYDHKFLSVSSYVQMRKVPTKITGWKWASFCKTQYASNPKYGGIPNFLKCHICLITLLDRIAQLPNVKVKINDEGHYGPYTCSDNYKEARALGRKPTYYTHKGQYSPLALVQEVNEYNELIAGFSGMLKDYASQNNAQILPSPIMDFQNFEQLEFKSRKDKKMLDLFLKTINIINDVATKSNCTSPDTDHDIPPSLN